MDNKTEKYCKHCGEIIDTDCVVCPKCGKQVEELKGNRDRDRDIIINNSSSSSAAAAMPEQIKRKLPWYLRWTWIFTLGMLSGGIYWIVGFVLRVMWKSKN